MSSQVYYRKFRPQTFAEVAGQDNITQTLRNAVATGRVSHAYLFCGPRGTGKTSTGRILAKALNCLSPVNGEPCNKCATCQAYAEGRAMDVIEIDAASNGGVEDIRDLRQKVSYSPNVAKYKVYIVDEAHMLSPAGCNALLKTLEEPPPHVVFVLATTESHKMMATIQSRCQRFDFRRVPLSAVVGRLAYICAQEGLTVPTEALRLVSRAATGSLRDAANLLEQVVAFYGKSVTFEQVREMLGVTGDGRVRELAGQVLGRDAAGGLRTISSVNADGLDLRQFNREVVHYLRDLLMVKSGAEATVDVTAEDMADMKKLADKVSVDNLLRIVRIFNELDSRQDSYAPLPLELAVVESALPVESVVPPAKAARPAEPVAKAPKAVEAPAVSPAPARTPPAAVRPAAVPAPAPVPTPERPKAPEPVVAEAKSAPPATPPPAPAAATGPEPAAVPPAGTLDAEYIRAHWKDFVDSLRGVGSSGNMDAYLRGVCEAESLEGDTVVLAFKFDFHKAKIEDPKYRHLVEKKLLDVFGRPLQVRCVLRERGKSTGEPDNYMARAAMKMGARVVARKPTTEGMMNRNMLRQAQELQARLAKVQAEIAEMTVEASAGGGAVTVVIDGALKVRSVKISPEVAREDAEMLQDLVTAAVNEAIAKSQEMAGKKLSAITGGLKIPGMG